MSIIKCKMCGADIAVQDGKAVAQCEYCGVLQTVPVIDADNENLCALYNRANILRLKAEFDKAEEIYEKILLSDEKQAEAYWGVLLCKYGVEYVQDPVSGQRVPTCHRASYDAMSADEYFKLALQYAGSEQRSIYEYEAKYIDNVQKGIIEISSREEPYDVFICYKESDNGVRTRDSVIANDIYHLLTAEGFKVFYAAISLEDKLGSQYEPVIFAALNSAKVMLAIGTKPEYLNAAWVKNEWSRFLKIIKNDRKKLLIPCYKDMDAYELPEEFSHLQTQDMGKIGFITDVIRGVKKVLDSFKEKPAVNNITNVTNVTNRTTNVSGEDAGAPAVSPILERAFMFLEDGDFENADRYAEKALDINPKEAEAYLVKLLVELKLKNRNDLQNLKEPLAGNKNYEKVIRFGDEDLKKEVEGYNAAIIKRIEDEAEEQAQAELKARQELEEKRRRFAEYVQKNKDKIEFASKLINGSMSTFVALKADGSVYSNNNALKCWRDIRAVYAVENTAVGLRKDGTIEVPNDLNTPMSLKSLAASVFTKNIKSVASGNGIPCGLCVAVLNDKGVVTHTNSFKKDIKGCFMDVAVGSDVYGLTAEGSVINTLGHTQCTDVLKMYAFGDLFACIKKDGTVFINNSEIQSHITDWKNIIKLQLWSDGKFHTIVGLTNEGKVLSWTNSALSNCTCPDGEWNDIVDINLHVHGFSLTCLTKHGTVITTKRDCQKNVADWERIIAITQTQNEIYGLTYKGVIINNGEKLFNSLDTVLEEYGAIEKAPVTQAKPAEKTVPVANKASNEKMKARLAELKKEQSELALKWDKVKFFKKLRRKAINKRTLEISAEIEKLEKLLKNKD